MKNRESNKAAETKELHRRASRSSSLSSMEDRYNKRRSQQDLSSGRIRELKAKLDNVKKYQEEHGPKQIIERQRQSQYTTFPADSLELSVSIDKASNPQINWMAPKDSLENTHAIPSMSNTGQHHSRRYKNVRIEEDSLYNPSLQNTKPQNSRNRKNANIEEDSLCMNTGGHGFHRAPGNKRSSMGVYQRLQAEQTPVNGSRSNRREGNFHSNPPIERSRRSSGSRNNHCSDVLSQEQQEQTRRGRRTKEASYDTAQQLTSNQQTQRLTHHTRQTSEQTNEQIVSNQHSRKNSHLSKENYYHRIPRPDKSSGHRVSREDSHHKAPRYSEHERQRDHRFSREGSRRKPSRDNSSQSKRNHHSRQKREKQDVYSKAELEYRHSESVLNSFVDGIKRKKYAQHEVNNGTTDSRSRARFNYSRDKYQKDEIEKAEVKKDYKAKIQHKKHDTERSIQTDKLYKVEESCEELQQNSSYTHVLNHLKNIVNKFESQAADAQKEFNEKRKTLQDERVKRDEFISLMQCQVEHEKKLNAYDKARQEREYVARKFALKRGQSHAVHDRGEQLQSLDAYGNCDLNRGDSYKDICHKNKDAKEEGEKYYSLRTRNPRYRTASPSKTEKQKYEQRAELLPRSIHSQDRESKPTANRLSKTDIQFHRHEDSILSFGPVQKQDNQQDLNIPATNTLNNKYNRLFSDDQVQRVHDIKERHQKELHDQQMDLEKIKRRKSGSGQGNELHICHPDAFLGRDHQEEPRPKRQSVSIPPAERIPSLDINLQRVVYNDHQQVDSPKYLQTTQPGGGQNEDEYPPLPTSNEQRQVTSVSQQRPDYHQLPQRLSSREYLIPTSFHYQRDHPKGLISSEFKSNFAFKNGFNPSRTNLLSNDQPYFQDKFSGEKNEPVQNDDIRMHSTQEHQTASEILYQKFQNEHKHSIYSKDAQSTNKVPVQPINLSDIRKENYIEKNKRLRQQLNSPKNISNDREFIHALRITERSNEDSHQQTIDQRDPEALVYKYKQAIEAEKIKGNGSRSLSLNVEQRHDKQFLLNLQDLERDSSRHVLITRGSQVGTDPDQIAPKDATQQLVMDKYGIQVSKFAPKSDGLTSYDFQQTYELPNHMPIPPQASESQAEQTVKSLPYVETQQKPKVMQFNHTQKILKQPESLEKEAKHNFTGGLNSAQPRPVSNTLSKNSSVQFQTIPKLPEVFNNVSTKGHEQQPEWVQSLYTHLCQEKAKVNMLQLQMSQLATKRDELDQSLKSQIDQKKHFEEEQKLNQELITKNKDLLSLEQKLREELIEVRTNTKDDSKAHHQSKEAFGQMASILQEDILQLNQLFGSKSSAQPSIDSAQPLSQQITNLSEYLHKQLSNTLLNKIETQMCLSKINEQKQKNMEEKVKMKENSELRKKEKEIGKLKIEAERIKASYNYDVRNKEQTIQELIEQLERQKQESSNQNKHTADLSKEFLKQQTFLKELNDKYKELKHQHKKKHQEVEQSKHKENLNEACKLIEKLQLQTGKLIKEIESNKADMALKVQENLRLQDMLNVHQQFKKQMLQEVQGSVQKGVDSFISKFNDKQSKSDQLQTTLREVNLEILPDLNKEMISSFVQTCRFEVCQDQSEIAIQTDAIFEIQNDSTSRENSVQVMDQGTKDLINNQINQINKLKMSNSKLVDQHAVHDKNLKKMYEKVKASKKYEHFYEKLKAKKFRNCGCQVDMTRQGKVMTKSKNVSPYREILQAKKEDAGQNISHQGSSRVDSASISPSKKINKENITSNRSKSKTNDKKSKRSMSKSQLVGNKNASHTFGSICSQTNQEYQMTPQLSSVNADTLKSKANYFGSNDHIGISNNAEEYSDVIPQKQIPTPKNLQIIHQNIIMNTSESACSPQRMIPFQQNNPMIKNTITDGASYNYYGYLMSSQEESNAFVASSDGCTQGLNGQYSQQDLLNNPQLVQIIQEQRMSRNDAKIQSYQDASKEEQQICSEQTKSKVLSEQSEFHQKIPSLVSNNDSTSHIQSYLAAAKLASYPQVNTMISNPVVNVNDITPQFANPNHCGKIQEESQHQTSNSHSREDGTTKKIDQQLNYLDIKYDKSNKSHK